MTDQVKDWGEAPEDEVPKPEPELASRTPYDVTLTVIYDDTTHQALWAAYAMQHAMGIDFHSGFVGLGATPAEATATLAARIHEWAAAWRTRPAQTMTPLQRVLRGEGDGS